MANMPLPPMGVVNNARASIPATPASCHGADGEPRASLVLDSRVRTTSSHRRWQRHHPGGRRLPVGANNTATPRRWGHGPQSGPVDNHDDRRHGRIGGLDAVVLDPHNFAAANSWPATANARRRQQPDPLADHADGHLHQPTARREAAPSREPRSPTPRPAGSTF